MRVPEAYLLLQPFDTKRPGLLVLDADGRRVASISLRGKRDVAAVAGGLTKALTATARDRVLMRVPEGALEEVSKQLGAIKGADAPKALPGGFVEVWCTKGAVTPEQVASIAKATKQAVELVDPVPVNVEATHKDTKVQTALAKVGGVRHISTTDTGTVAWISRWLLHPATLKAVGLTGDLETVIYRFEDLPKGASAAKHFKRPLTEKGVLSVIPRVGEGAIEVVVRPKVHDAEKTLAALTEGGLTLVGK